jgi:hypothetical protein
VQDSAVFCEVNLLPPEHGVDAHPQAGFLRRLQEEPEGFVGGAGLRIIEVEAHRLGRHALAVCGIIREELPQMQLPDLLIVGGEGLPCSAFGEWCSACGCLYSFHFLVAIDTLPQAKPSQERIGVAARSATWRELLQFFGVAPAKHHIVGAEGGNQAGHHVRHMLLPFLLAEPL